MDTKTEITGILLIPALAIAYYFAIALPENQRERLAFEKQKYENEWKKKASDEERQFTEKEANARELSECLLQVESDYWSYIKLNGNPVPGKAGTYTARISTWNIADKNKKDAIEECHRRYGK